jgi:hypothetical protein
MLYMLTSMLTSMLICGHQCCIVDIKVVCRCCKVSLQILMSDDIDVDFRCCISVFFLIRLDDNIHVVSQHHVMMLTLML